MKNERRTIKRIQKGDQVAFKALFDAYVEYVLRTSYVITNNRNHAADIVQEVFIRVYNNIGSFDVKRPFKPWLYRILLNESRRYMKVQQLQASTMEEDALFNMLHIQQDGAGNERVHYAVENMLIRLTENHRIILTLKYLEGFSEKEIAALLDLNINTVKSRLYKARNKARLIYGGVINE